MTTVLELKKLGDVSIVTQDRTGLSCTVPGADRAETQKAAASAAFGHSDMEGVKAAQIAQEARSFGLRFGIDISRPNIHAVASDCGGKWGPN